MASVKPSPRKRLRSSDVDMYLIGKCEEKIVGAKLPSNMQVLRFFFYNVKQKNKTHAESTRLVLNTIVPFWQKAHIPILSQRTCITKINKLQEQYEAAKEVSNSKNPNLRKIENDFKHNLNNLFDIAHVNALKIINIQQDRDFLIKQREEGRVGCMIGIDKLPSKKEKQLAERSGSDHRRNQNRQPTKNTSELAVDSECVGETIAGEDARAMESDNSVDCSDDDSECAVESIADEDVQAMESNNNGDCSDQPIKLLGKKHFIDDRMLACMDAGQMHSELAIQFISATANALGHDVNELVLDCASLRKQRVEYRQRQSKVFLDNSK